VAYACVRSPIFTNVEALDRDLGALEEGNGYLTMAGCYLGTSV
jgi:hypothetical protein